MMKFSEFLKRLQRLDRQQVIAVAQRAEVSEHTLIKVWRGDTENPGVLLVEQVAPYLEQVAA
jgi:hypothetical protein